MSHSLFRSLPASVSIAFAALALAGPMASTLAQSGAAPATADPQSVQSDAQVLFNSPEDAVVAMIDAVRLRDRDALKAIIGPSFDRLVSGDLNVDEADLQRFIAAYDARNSLLDYGNGTYTLVMGLHDWEFPAPIVGLDGKWWFDGAQGVEEVLNRVIGEHELRTIQVCRAYPRLQQMYFELDPDGDGVKAYAMHTTSTKGKRDGLYWPDAPGAPRSPIGPHVAEAYATGELSRDADKANPYYGYYYRVLTHQGPGAPGGARNYIDTSGKMTGGFALIAWPASYGDSGITTFIVAQDGVVYQRDLGEKTAELVKEIVAYDPAGWTRVGDDGMPVEPAPAATPTVEPEK